jgi:hypothetical protein
LDDDDDDLPDDDDDDIPDEEEDKECVLNRYANGTENDSRPATADNHVQPKITICESST